MKIWGNSGGRTDNRKPSSPLKEKPQSAPVRRSNPPPQPGPAGNREPFEIDWEAVWRREEEARLRAAKGQAEARSQAGQIPDFVVKAQAGRTPAPQKRAAPPQPSKGGRRKKKKKSHWFRNLLLAVLLLAGLYCTAVFSNIPFIAKWRTIYIETAMSTMTHQWLATAFIPPSVIAEVENNREKQENNQLNLESNWNNLQTPSFDFGQAELSPWEKLKEDFFQNYPEIQQQSFEDYMAEHQDEVIDENGYLT